MRLSAILPYVLILYNRESGQQFYYLVVCKNFHVEFENSLDAVDKCLRLIYLFYTPLFQKHFGKCVPHVWQFCECVYGIKSKISRYPIVTDLMDVLDQQRNIFSRENIIENENWRRFRILSGITVTSFQVIVKFEKIFQTLFFNVL